MMKSIYAVAAAGMMLSALAVDANALPMPRVGSQDEATSVTPVADGCGWRRHYSRRLGHCVWN